MKKMLSYFVVLTICLTLVVPAVYSAPKFTLETRSTWDADMINVDDVFASTDLSGEGVYVAVLDTGLVPNWKDYFPVDKIATNLGKGFVEDMKWDPITQTFIESGKVRETTFIGSIGSSHGTHVTSTILGYNYYAPADAASGYPLPPVFVEGIAPNVTIIPVKVLSDYTFGKGHSEDGKVVFGTDRAVAAGIRYATDLKIAGYGPMVITMSLGGGAPAQVIEDAIDYAIENGVIVVASAGNEGEDGMGWPGAYDQVISVGACGWKYEWYGPDYTTPPPRYRLWWLQDDTHGFNDVAESDASEVYICNFSSRQLDDQFLDIVAPGSWVRGPYPGSQNYAHLPWWSNGVAYGNPGNFYYVGGTSMAAPHVTGVVALMLEKNGGLTQSQVESILTDNALPIPAGSMTVFDISPTQGFYTHIWGDDATGAGLLQADLAIGAVP